MLNKDVMKKSSILLNLISYNKVLLTKLQQLVSHLHTTSLKDTIRIRLVVCSLLHKTPSYSHKSLLASPTSSSSRSTVPHIPQSLTFNHREDSYPRDVTCPVTLLHVSPFISLVSPVTHSVTSPSGFPQGLSDQFRMICLLAV